MRVAERLRKQLRYTPGKKLGHRLALWLDADQSMIETDESTALASASTQYFTATAAAAVNGIAAGTWRAGWLYMTAQGVQKTILSTLSGNDGLLIEVTAGNVLSATIGTGSTTVTKAHGTTLSATTWYFWYVEYDGTNLGLSINGGALATEAAAAFSPGSSNLFVGATVTPDTYWDGRLAMLMGGDNHDDSAIPASLYNSGSGKFYVDVTSTENTTWGTTFAFFQEPPSLTSDAHGSNTLTNNNTATYAVGPTRRLVWADGQPIARWYDVREASRASPVYPYVANTTAAARPLYKTNIQNGKPVVRYDGIDDRLVFTGLSIASGSLYFGFALSQTVANNKCVFDSQTGRLVLYPGNANGTGNPGWYDGAFRNGGAAGTAAFQFLEYVLDASGSTGDVYRDGSLLGSDTYSEKALGGTCTLGGQFDLDGYLTGDIGSAFIYDGLIDTSSRQSLEAYMSNKWAI